MAELIRQWRCEDPQCHNNGKPCFIIDGKHHKILPNQLTTWDGSIVLGITTLEHPPVGMNFFPVQKQTPSIPQAPQVPPQPPPYAWSTPYPWQPPVLPPISIVSPPTVPSALPAPVPSSTVENKPTTQENPLTSSPLACDTDPGDLVADYFEWMAKRSPRAHDELESLLERIQEGFYDLESIREFKDDDWVRLQAPIGLGRRLARDIRVFKRERRNQVL